jgi:alpha-L-fucosidase
MCTTINNSWGYNAADHSHKSLEELVHLLVKASGYDANLLLNVGPKPDGTIQPEFVERLAEVGDWLRENGESIYGTRGGPITPRPWGVTTHKGSRVYVHVLDWPDPVLALPRPPRPVQRARYLADGREVPFEVDRDALLLRLDPRAADPIDTIVVLELAEATMTGRRAPGHTVDSGCQGRRSASTRPGTIGECGRASLHSSGGSPSPSP